MSSIVRSCIELNEATEDEKETRVGIIAAAKPNCECEFEPFSRFSPGLIHDDEIISRVVCEPMHVNPKKLELLPSFFSHALRAGASVQRHDISTDAQFVECVKGLVSSDTKKVWLGYVTASAREIRRLMLNGEDRDCCVYDAALEHNPAHAEVHAARDIPEADRIVFRKQLRDLFARDGLKGRKALREQRVWDALPSDLRDRPVAEVWREAAG
ncbi:hypothetical protein [Acidovorax sp.]|uniref:hypothetical protein n=1 Tax=Acidovorax sp. TaxID=1872122 RepID=UPI00391F23C4